MGLGVAKVLLPCRYSRTLLYLTNLNDNSASACQHKKPIGWGVTGKLGRVTRVVSWFLNIMLRRGLALLEKFESSCLGQPLAKLASILNYDDRHEDTLML
jgi:hypothetical protein